VASLAAQGLRARQLEEYQGREVQRSLVQAFPILSGSVKVMENTDWMVNLAGWISLGAKPRELTPWLLENISRA
jgi:hypothetical protein